jgi:hypothetical protein
MTVSCAPAYRGIMHRRARPWGLASVVAGAVWLAVMPPVQAVDPAPQAPPQHPPGTAAPASVVSELQAELATAVQQMQRRDTEGVLSHVSEQYRTGPFNKLALRRQLQTMFAIYDAITVRARIDTVRMLGDQAWVYSTGEVAGRLQWVGHWVPVLSWQRELEVARRENGVWRLIGYQQ